MYTVSVSWTFCQDISWLTRSVVVIENEVFYVCHRMFCSVLA